MVPGPVVTMFEYKPAPGVKISRIAGLSDDLALALKASAVRIEAPWARARHRGVEIPKRPAQTVYLREIMQSAAFHGLDPADPGPGQGHPRPATTRPTYREQPHLPWRAPRARARAYASTSILLSFLYKAPRRGENSCWWTPKRIELSVYADIQQLVHPVVTDLALAKNALDWAVYERRSAMTPWPPGRAQYRGFNTKLEGSPPNRPRNSRTSCPAVPGIVIDELADLMLTARKEVETSIVRLAQLARAAGIHMIIATQRPSVDVVTGLIKANFPTRISFQVTSKHDSRTILDTVGAEHLLGRGDMLFKPGGGKTVRLHGALVDEEEIGRVIEFWKAGPSRSTGWTSANGRARARTPRTRASKAAPGAGRHPRRSGLPRGRGLRHGAGQGLHLPHPAPFPHRLHRAARFVEQMEQDGVIGPADGAKPRTVLKG